MPESELSGEVEVDEMFHGGKRKAGVGRRPAPKVPVMGLVERGGRVVATVVSDVSSWSLMPSVTKRVLADSTVFTDGHKGYDNLAKVGYQHRRINHNAGVFVSGNVHTQTIENFWSLVRRGIGGVYHSVSAKHLHGYLNEYVWRYNHRDESRAMFLSLLLRAAQP